ncbi:MAG TPA: AAA family ATPase [Desulfuromonadales bacterium]
MILRRLELKHFGRFEDCTFDFRRGLNLVSGPSESGKSTIAEAIPLILFGTPDGDRFRPWAGSAGNWVAALVFEEAGRILRIERDFLTGQITLNETDAEGHSLHHFSGKAAFREETAESAAYRAELLRLFGLAEEELFRFGLFFEQGYATRFAAEGGTGVAKSLLAKKIGRERPADPGVEGEIEAVRRRLAELERLWFETRKTLAEGSELPGKIAVLEASIEADRVDFAKGEKFLAQARRVLGETAKTVSPVVGRHREPAPAADLEARRQQLERELAKTGLPRQMPGDLPGVLVQADEIRQELIAIQKEAADLRQQLLKRPAPSWRPAALTTLLSALVVAALAWSHSAWLMAGLAAGTLATAVGWAIYFWRLGQERHERSRLKGPLQVLEERREEAQARLAGLDDRFSRVGLSPSAVEIVRMQKNLERHLRLQQELAEVESALGAAVSDENPAALEVVAGRNSAGTEESSTMIAPEGHLPISGAEFAVAESDLAALGERLKSREAKLQELTHQAAERESLRESLRQIEEEGEALRRRESELARRPSATSPAADGSIPRPELAQLATDIGQTLGMLTADRYTAVRLDEGEVWSLRGMDGEWHPLKHFSRGTTESFCLALRLILGRQLTGGRRLPLILDDALTGFDLPRLADIVKLLERLAGDQQVILLSCDESLRKRANRERWHTISLATETTEKPSRTQERSDDDGQLHLL